jgi:hypothetical protein
VDKKKGAALRAAPPRSYERLDLLALTFGVVLGVADALMALTFGVVLGVADSPTALAFGVFLFCDRLLVLGHLWFLSCLDSIPAYQHIYLDHRFVHGLRLIASSVKELTHPEGHVAVREGQRDIASLLIFLLAVDYDAVRVELTSALSPHPNRVKCATPPG